MLTGACSAPKSFFHSVYTAISSNKTSTKGRITDGDPAHHTGANKENANAASAAGNTSFHGRRTWRT